MQVHSLKLITIIGESVLESRLLGELKQLGAKGYTVTSAHGEGSRGVRAGELPGDDVRIETIVSPVVADRILSHVATNYFANYAVVAFVSDIGVVRGDRYV
jgi:nitrogen regulatory protein P-II 2